MRTILFFLLVVFSAWCYAQSTSKATASVTIVKPISINQEAELIFGEVLISETSGTVVLFSDGSRTAAGGASFPYQNTKIPTAASFIVTGEESDYSISLPAAILLRDGTRSLKVDNFTHTGTGSAANGVETVNIGATLHINGRQVPGTYQTNNGMRVTVQYK